MVGRVPDFFYIILFGVLTFFLVGHYSTTPSLEPYYAEMLPNTPSLGIPLPPQTTQTVAACLQYKKNKIVETCLTRVYTSLTELFGPERTLVDLKQRLLSTPSLTPHCHYITHGIGAGSTVFNKNNPLAGFHLDVADYFPNLTSCADGFYHGITIGMTAGITDNTTLVKKLGSICNITTSVPLRTCHHGVGHAVTIHTEHDRDSSLALCRAIYPASGPGFFECATGVFMELLMRDLSLEIVIPHMSTISATCGAYTEHDVREACITEYSSILPPMNATYLGRSYACMNFTKRNDRISCIRLTVNHAVRLDRYPYAADICRIPPTWHERTGCLTYLAWLTASSVDPTQKKESFQRISKAICRSNGLLTYFGCMQSIRKGETGFRAGTHYNMFPTRDDLRSLWE